jgi:hypothetical protein
LSAQPTLTGGACPAAGSTAAISCYDNGGDAIDDSLAQQDLEPIGGICFKSACLRTSHARCTLCLPFTPPRAAAMPVTYTDPTDGAWYWCVRAPPPRGEISLQAMTCRPAYVGRGGLPRVPTARARCRARWRASPTSRPP